jgi:hypothetical protein
MGGLALCGVGVLLDPGQFFRSYLLAYLFWLGLPLGCLGILMLHYLVGGTWGAIIRRILESGTRTLPLMVLFFVPLLFGLHELYSWAVSQVVAQDELLRHKSPYLNVPFFVGRLAVYFVVWLVPAYLLNRWSRQQDRTPEWSAQRPIRRRLILLSGLGLLLYGFTMSFAAIDWMMSLEPHWHSSIYGLLVVVGQLLGAMAFVVVVTGWLADYAPLSEVLSPTCRKRSCGTCTERRGAGSGWRWRWRFSNSLCPSCFCSPVISNVMPAAWLSWLDSSCSCTWWTCSGS